MFQFWKNLSIAKKLSFVVGTMAFLIAMELFTLYFAMETLSAVRTFVGGESLWSKAQKNATHSLYSYALTKDEAYYRDFKNYLEIQIGDRIAHHELRKDNPDRVIAAEGLLRGGVHPKDVEGVLDFIIRFRKLHHVSTALDTWSQGDKYIDQLVAQAEQLHSAITQKKDTPLEIKKIIAEIDVINAKLTRLEVDFSTVLGEGSRWLEHLLMVVLILAVLTVESTGLILAISFSQNLNRSLKEISHAATEVGKGNLNVVVPVHSEDELGQLANAINKMTADLEVSIQQRVLAENASQVKTLFLANMSHEIRTPLGIIIGMTDILKDPSVSEAEKLEYVDIIAKTGKNLTRIINDILDITKVEAGHLEVEATQFLMSSFVKEFESMMSIKALENNNKLQVVAKASMPAEISADRNRLQQILINLSSNALKFTHNGSVTITYGLSGREYFFEVKDSGIGIPHEAQKDLFQHFSQIDSSSTRRYEGTGLGLVLSKKLAASMGGDVILKESSPGGGSTFLLTLPQNLATQIVTPKPSTPIHLRADKNLQGHTVLIVDDSNDNQMLIRHYLQKRGVICFFADNGQVALEKALQMNFDVILMDMQMPVMDGYTATKELRDHNYIKPIIALTAHAMKEDRDRCLRVGCNDYLTKPIEAVQLYKTLEDHIFT
ncbi:MAG: response regulator [Bdellovibrio sp.]